MLIYVAHEFGADPANIERARQITHDLQQADTDNTYITPLLAFTHLKYNELGYEQEMRLCLELLSKCDKLIVASKVSKGVQIEIEYCERERIPVEYRLG